MHVGSMADGLVGTQGPIRCKMNHGIVPGTKHACCKFRVEKALYYLQARHDDGGLSPKHDRPLKR